MVYCLFVDSFDEPSRIASHDRIGLYVVRHDTSRTYDTVLANCHAWQDGRTCSNPRLAPNMHRFAGDDRPVI